MSEPEYRWRRLTDAQRDEVMAWRKMMGEPWHSPPHRQFEGQRRFLVTAACFEHRACIGLSADRMGEFSASLLAALAEHPCHLHAWCVLPNHYHVLVETESLKLVLAALGRLHGRCSFKWNGEEGTRGRQVWFRCLDRAIRTDAHHHATLNYVHHNPVHHGYATRWRHWPWGSAAIWLDEVGDDEARRLWQAFPVDGYGQGWDDPAR